MRRQCEDASVELGKEGSATDAPPTNCECSWMQSSDLHGSFMARGGSGCSVGIGSTNLASVTCGVTTCSQEAPLRFSDNDHGQCDPRLDLGPVGLVAAGGRHTGSSPHTKEMVIGLPLNAGKLTPLLHLLQQGQHHRQRGVSSLPETPNDIHGKSLTRACTPLPFPGSATTSWNKGTCRPSACPGG